MPVPKSDGVVTVHVDFNDLGYNDKDMVYSCYPDHCGGLLEMGDEVILDDGEGTTCRGTVIEFKNFGRGDLVYCQVIPGTWGYY